MKVLNAQVLTALRDNVVTITKLLTISQAVSTWIHVEHGSRCALKDKLDVGSFQVCLRRSDTLPCRDTGRSRAGCGERTAYASSPTPTPRVLGDGISDGTHTSVGASGYIYVLCVCVPIFTCIVPFRSQGLDGIMKIAVIEAPG